MNNLFTTASPEATYARRQGDEKKRRHKGVATINFKTDADNEEESRVLCNLSRPPRPR